MNWIGIALKILLQLPTILQAVEDAADGESGISEEKKNLAKMIIKSLVSGFLGVSGNDLDKILKRVYLLVDPIIDLLVSVLFPHDEALNGGS